MSLFNAVVDILNFKNTLQETAKPIQDIAENTVASQEEENKEATSFWDLPKMYSDTKQLFNNNFTDEQLKKGMKTAYSTVSGLGSSMAGTFLKEELKIKLPFLNETLETIDTLQPVETPVETVNGSEEEITSPIVQPSPLEIKPVAQNIQESTNINKSNFEVARTQAENAYNLSLASFGARAVESIFDYKTNKKNLEFNKKMAEKQIDQRLMDYETMLNDRLAESSANLDTSAAARNVDLRSQGLASLKTEALSNMGEDIANETTKAKLQKAALNLSTAYQKSSLKSNMVSSLIGAGLSAYKSYGDWKSYDFAEGLVRNEKSKTKV